MPRIKRITYPGAIFHVLNRGVSKSDIFLDTQDYLFFLSQLSESYKDLGIQILSYALMGNHYHLLIKDTEGELSKGIGRLALRYTKRFNWRHGRDGPLFKARFTSILVEDDSYLRAVALYINKNPEEAGLVAKSSNYPWCSQRFLINAEPPPEWFDPKPVWEEFGGPRRFLASSVPGKCQESARYQN